MVLGERRHRSVIAKLVELAIALLALLMPASALAFTRAPLPESGLGGLLNAALRGAGIEYWHVPW